MHTFSFIPSRKFGTLLSHIGGLVTSRIIQRLEITNRAVINLPISYEIIASGESVYMIMRPHHVACQGDRPGTLIWECRELHIVPESLY
jgi:hypothetical protein